MGYVKLHLRMKLGKTKDLVFNEQKKELKFEDELAVSLKLRGLFEVM